jgi:hypothetical protein
LGRALFAPNWRNAEKLFAREYAESMPKKEKPPDIRRLLYILVQKSLDLEKSGFFANQASCNASGVNLVSSIGNSLPDGGYFVVPKVRR